MISRTKNIKKFWRFWSVTPVAATESGIAWNPDRDTALSLQERRKAFFRASRFVGFYALWVLITRLILVTFVTYFLNFSAHRPARFEEIGEASSSIELLVVGLSAALFLLLMRGFQTAELRSHARVFSGTRIEKKFIPGFLHGALLASGVVMAFLISGLDRYLGVYIQFENLFSGAFSILLRIAALLAMVLAEEFIFRSRVLYEFRRYFRNFGGDRMAILVTSILYCFIKYLQFDLGVTHLLTLFLVSIAVSFRTLADQDFVRGAGFWAAILIVFHPLLSLPVFGNEYSGLILIKYAQSSVASPDSLPRLLSGGSSGPLSSFAFQLLLIFDIIRGLIRYRRV